MKEYCSQVVILRSDNNCFLWKSEHSGNVLLRYMQRLMYYRVIYFMNAAPIWMFKMWKRIVQKYLKSFIA